GQPWHDGRQLDRAAVGKAVLLYHAPGDELRVGEHVGDAVDLAHRHIGRAHDLERLVDGTGAAPGLDGAIDFFDPAGAAVVARQLRVVGQVVAADGAHQAVEDGVAIARDDHVLAVARSVGIGWHDAGQRPAGAFAHDAGHVVLGHQAFHQVEYRLVQRHIHHLALPRHAVGARLAVPAAAGGVAMAQGHHGADDRMQRGDGVAYRDAYPHRGAVGVARNVAQAAHGFGNGAESRRVAHGARLPVARQAHHDERGIDLAQLFVPQPPLFEHAGTIVLDHDVGIEREAAGDLAASGVFQVQRDGFFVARLHSPPKRVAFVQVTPAADGVASARAIGALRGFDLDDFGAEFAQHAGREGPGDQRAEFEDFDALERGHGSLLGGRLGGFAFHQGPGDGAGVDVLELAAGRHAARQAGDLQPFAGKDFTQKVRSGFAFGGEVGGQDDFLHHAIAGALDETLEVEFARADALERG